GLPRILRKNLNHFFKSFLVLRGKGWSSRFQSYIYVPKYWKLMWLIGRPSCQVSSLAFPLRETYRELAQLPWSPGAST
ncbi:hypothetical protein NDU88_001115, partial [Pleurodeles waltl]